MTEKQKKRTTLWEKGNPMQKLMVDKVIVNYFKQKYIKAKNNAMRENEIECISKNKPLTDVQSGYKKDDNGARKLFVLSFMNVSRFLVWCH